MNKKTKLILSGLGATAGIVIIPLAVVACSSTVAEVSTKSTSNLTDKGFLSNTNPLLLTIKDIPLTGLPNQNGKSTVGELSKYISVTNSLTGISLPESTIVSDISFTNGDSSTPAKISFSLGVDGSFILIAKQSGLVDKDTTYDWTFNSPNFSTGKDLMKYLDGIENTGLESANTIIDPANTSISYNPNGIQQYIWFSKLYNNDQVEPLGALVGTWSSQNQTWDWVYNLNQSRKIIPNSEINDLGIPSEVTNLDQLSKWIDFLPELNQYSISKDAKVTVSSVNNNTQSITIIGSNNSITITGKYSNNYWSYNYSTEQTIYFKMKEYIDQINKLKFNISFSAASALPSQVNGENISQYIDNFPTQPAGTNITYKLVADDITGKLSVVVNISANGQPTLSSNSQEVSGFLKIQQAIDIYINALNVAELKLSSIASQHLPTEVNSENINTFINNIPTPPPGVTLGYILKPNDTTGDLAITISASAQGATTVTSAEKTLSGFLTTNQKRVNDYIALVNAATISANQAGDKFLASDSTNVTNDNLVNLIKGMPDNQINPVTLSFNILTRSNGSLTFNVTATLDGATATSETKTATGFLTIEQNEINNYINQVNAATISANPEGAKLLTSDALITNDSLLTYIKYLPLVPNGITIIFTINSRSNGSLIFTLIANKDGASATSVAKEVNGFLTTEQKTVNDYIYTLNNTALTLSTIAAQHFPSDVNDQNINDYINNLPPAPAGLTITYVLSANDATGELEITISASAQETTTVAATTKTLSGFLTTNQKAVNDYIALVNAATISANPEGEKLLSNDPKITSQDLKNYIKDLPEPTGGIIISFTIVTRTNGSLSFSLTATLGSASATSQTKKALGFLTENQKMVDEYINSINNIVLTVSTIASEHLPSEVTEQNVATFIANLPVIPAGLTITYDLVPNDATGELEITISASAQGTTTVVANKQNLGGFLTTNQKIVNEYIALVNEVAISANEVGDKLLATDTTNVTNDNLATLINGMPDNQINPVTLSFNILTRSNGSLTFNVTATLDGATATSETKTATGFLTTQQNELNNYISQVNGTTITANPEGAKLLTSDSLITDSTLQSYIKDLPEPTGGITINFTIKTRENGYIIFIVTATLDGTSVTSQNKIAIGFLTENQKTVNDYIDTLNNTALTLSAIAAQHFPSDVTNQNINDYINNLPPVPAGLTITYALAPNDTTGDLEITISASAQGTTTVAATKKTLSGFLTTDQKSVNDYIALVDAATISANPEGAKLLSSDPKITNEDLINYIKDLPQPTGGITISFTIGTRSNGSLSFSLTATLRSATATSQAKEVSGFLTENQKAVNDYIENLNNIVLTPTSIASQHLPSEVTEANVTTFIANLPNVPSGVTLTYVLGANDASGVLAITISATAQGATIVVATEQRLSGFLTTNQKRVNDYIALVNAATITANENGDKVLATNEADVRNDTLVHLINGMPDNQTDPVTLTFNILTRANGSLTFTVTATLDGATATSETKTAIGFFTNQQNDVNIYVKEVNAATMSANEEGAKLLSDDIKITDTTLQSYIKDLPPVPNGMTISFTIVTRPNGSLTFTLTATLDGATATSNLETAAGFLTTEQKTINDYIETLNNTTLTVTAIASENLPSEVTEANVATFIANLPPAPAAVTLTYALIANDTTGILELTISASTPDATTIAANQQSLGGFLTTNQKAVNEYIASVNVATISANTEGEKLLSDDPKITNATLENYIKDLPQPTGGITISFTIGTRSNGSLSFTLTATLGTATATSQEKTASGFLTTQQKAVNDYIIQFNGSTITINPEGQKWLATNTNGVTIANLDTLINGVPTVTDGITLTFNILTRTNGSLTFNVTANKEGASAISETKTVTGFLTNQEAVDNYINEVNDINTIITPNSEGLKLLATDTKDVRNNNLGELISGMPNNLQELNFTFNILTRANGSLTFTVAADINGATATSGTKTINGFLTVLEKINNLNLTPNPSFTAPQNVTSYTNFWNSEAIFANFDLTIEQVKALSSIENLYMKVSNSSLLTGTATLELFLKFDTTYESVGQVNYSGFYAGTAIGAQASVENYFSNNNNVAKWLNNYLNINPWWLINIFVKNNQSSNGAFFYGYNMSLNTVNKILFTNISVSNIDGIITINAIMPVPVDYESWNGSEFVFQGTTPANEPVTIQLPLLFKNSTDVNTKITSIISTSATGQTTISWSGFINEGIESIHAKYFFIFGTRETAFRLGGNTSINSIIF